MVLIRCKLYGIYCLVSSIMIFFGMTCLDGIFFSLLFFLMIVLGVVIFFNVFKVCFVFDFWIILIIVFKIIISVIILVFVYLFIKVEIRVVIIRIYMRMLLIWVKICCYKVCFCFVVNLLELYCFKCLFIILFVKLFCLFVFRLINVWFFVLLY